MLTAPARAVARRVPGQGTADEVRGKDLRKELQEREAEHLKRIGKAPVTKAPPPLPPPGACPPRPSRSRPAAPVV